MPNLCIYSFTLAAFEYLVSHTLFDTVVAGAVIHKLFGHW